MLTVHTVYHFGREFDVQKLPSGKLEGASSVILRWASTLDADYLSGVAN